MTQTSKITNVVKGSAAKEIARLRTIEQDAHAARLKLEKDLRATAARVKGTRDMPALGGLEVRIEVVLRSGAAPMSLVELARHLREPATKVQAVLRKLRETPCPTAAAGSGAMMIHNHGTDTDPKWSWVIGDAVDAQTLYAAIEVMLRRRPYTFAEVQRATGARHGRISGAMVQFGRDGVTPIYTVGGSDRKYVWFIGALSSLPADLRKHARSIRLDPL